MESQRHNLQISLLIDQIVPWLAQKRDGFVGFNLNAVARNLQDIEATWLRWATLDGVLLPTSKEQAEQLAPQLLAMSIQPEDDFNSSR